MDPATMQMLQALGMQQNQQQGMAQQPLNPLMQQMAQSPGVPTGPQNSSLGIPGGSSLGTPADAYSAMFQQAPGVGY